MSRIALFLLLSSTPGADGDPVEGASLVHDMYSFALDSYLSFAFPADEVRPVSCSPRWKRERGDLDLIVGNFSMTAIDALDSMLLFGKEEEMRKVLEYVTSSSLTFNKNLQVSTFEVNIRVLGGLLSTVLHTRRAQTLRKYSGKVLEKAVDLGERLSKAFETPTGLPFSRINLSFGQKGIKTSQVTAAEAGSFLLEFGVLSLLSGQKKFYRLARRAVLQVFHSRSSAGLIPTSMDVLEGTWARGVADGVGPGVDSFFEYLYKAAVLFGDLELLRMYETCVEALQKVQTVEGMAYPFELSFLAPSHTSISPLGAFYSGLVGGSLDVPTGLQSLYFWDFLFGKMRGLPESFVVDRGSVGSSKDFLLRPELMESNFYFLRLLKSRNFQRRAHFYARVINSRTRTNCGFATLKDVSKHKKKAGVKDRAELMDDRMDSFFLSETLVYLYLSLEARTTVEARLGIGYADMLFTTEGHIFSIREVKSIAENTQFQTIWDHRDTRFNLFLRIGVLGNREASVHPPQGSSTKPTRGSYSVPFQGSDLIEIEPLLFPRRLQVFVLSVTLEPMASGSGGRGPFLPTALKCPKDKVGLSFYLAGAGFKPGDWPLPEEGLEHTFLKVEAFLLQTIACGANFGPLLVYDYSRNKVDLLSERREQSGGFLSVSPLPLHSNSSGSNAVYETIFTRSDMTLGDSEPTDVERRDRTHQITEKSRRRYLLSKYIFRGHLYRGKGTERAETKANFHSPSNYNSIEGRDRLEDFKRRWKFSSVVLDPPLRKEGSFFPIVSKLLGLPSEDPDELYFPASVEVFEPSHEVDAPLKRELITAPEKHGCASFYDSQHEQRFQDKVVLLARGECFFSQKAANALAAGASGLIVYNRSEEEDLSFPPLSVMSGLPPPSAESPGVFDQQSLLQLSRLNLPTALIDSRTAKRVLSVLEQGGNLQVAMGETAVYT